MLILSFCLTLAAFVTFLVLRVKYPSKSKIEYDVHDFFSAMACVFGFLLMGLIIAICCLSTTVATERTIDNKIALYEEENAKIEQDIDKIVKEYMQYEKETFAYMKTEESSITLITLFPELKSDGLVQQQLDIYVSNNAKIRSMKEEKIDMLKIKWILYFG